MYAVSISELQSRVKPNSDGKVNILSICRNAELLELLANYLFYPYVMQMHALGNMYINIRLNGEQFGEF